RALCITGAHRKLRVSGCVGREQRPANIPGAGDDEGRPTFRAPRGISLWADLFEERKLIAIGAALENALGVASDRPPGY
ncbi:MAG: hypothetical protein AAFW68_12685, partial [Pseudomonadota bacterium]